MKQVASLQYGVIFKKAFSPPDIFKAFVKDIIGINLEIDKVETEKTYSQQIGRVKVEFDLYAEDTKNRVIVEVRHENNSDHYDRFLHYHCVALLEQAQNYKNYRPPLTVYTIVVLTSGDKHKTDVAVIDLDPKDRNGKPLNEIHHKVIYLAAKYVNDTTPEPYRDWLKIINESLTETIDESQYPRPELQTVIASIAKSRVSPEEKYWMIEEYNFEEAKKQQYNNGLKTAAKNSLAAGLPVEMIAQITGLSVADIEALKNGAHDD